jgi:hypothetical protein
MYRFALLALLLSEAGGRSSEAPQLRIDAPPEFAAIRARLESVDPQSLAGIASVIGITDTGSPIHVVLTPESSNLARTIPPWISGFAVPPSDLVVLFPARSPSYPDKSLEDVLRHEIAHVLIWRAIEGRPIPRWFNEGLAMEVERGRRFRDQTQLLYQLVMGSRTTLDELDRLFSGGESDQTRAYALAGALVHDMFQRYGPAACAEILKRVNRGNRFDSAFSDVTGVTASDAESEFWQRQRIWTVWVPIVTSSTTVWMVVTLIAILAIYMRRRRNREIEERWAKEEEEDDFEP